MLLFLFLYLIIVDTLFDYRMSYSNDIYRGLTAFSQGYVGEPSKLEYLLAKSEPLSNLKSNYYKEYSFSAGLYEKSPYSSRLHKTYHFPVDAFLNDKRPIKPVVQDSGSIFPLVEQAFLSTTNKPLPQNISITICSAAELKEIHSQYGAWSEGIAGFVVPGKMHRIFIRMAPLDELLLVIGHEIGHIYTEQLPNIHDEEAKAFAFSIEWVRKIREHNIGELKESIKEEFDFNPARNGLHDLAFFFVKHLLKKQAPMEVHHNLSRGYLSFFDLYL